MHADGSKEYYFKDHIGSARVVLLRSAAGVVTVKAKYEYKPFGGLVSSTSGKSDRHGYTGDEFDFESDLVDMGARMYMPEIGRFLAVDPLAEAFPTQSPYNFALNNPINFRDPSGLAPEKEKGDRVLSSQGFISMSDGLGTALSKASESNYLSFQEFNRMSRRWRSDCARLATWGAEVAQGLSYGLGGGGNGVSKGAWQITNSWTPEMIAKYREFAPKQAEMYKKSGKEFTCEDLALEILVDFASQNGLNIIIETEKEIFDASDSKWNGDIQSFRDLLLDKCGAKEVQSDANTCAISFEDATIGDLMLKALDHADGIAHHVQLITGIDANGIDILQGNTKNRSIKNGNPSSIFYPGKPIERGRFNTETGNYKNFTTGYYGVNEIKSFIARQWRFYKFNK